MNRVTEKDKKSHEIYAPKSRLVAKQLIEKIRSGEYQPGDRLESIRELAERYNVGRQVISSAFSLLAKQDYVYLVHGSGTYVNTRLTPGRYFRLGWFINGLNPVGSGNLLCWGNAFALAHGYQLILGSNFEDNFTLEEWLRRKNDLDGVIIGGLVDEQLLRYPRLHRIPYVVAGNYDIAVEHPQCCYDLEQTIRAELVDLFRRHHWKKIATIAGIRSNRSDRETLDATAAAIRDAGLPLYDELIITSPDDGYREFASILPRHNPDALIIWGEHYVGLRKYFLDYPNQPRPTIIVNEAFKDRLADGFYSHTIGKSVAYDKQYVNNIVKTLINIVETKANG